MTFVFGDHTIHHLARTALLPDCQYQSFIFLCLLLTVFPAQRALYPTIPHNEVDNQI